MILPGKRGIMIEMDDPGGFGERPQRGFTGQSDARAGFYSFVLDLYNYRCAISGLQFPPPDGTLHKDLDVVLIHPRELDGPFEIGNAIVLELSLATAFKRGLITVSDYYQLVIPHPEELSDAERSLVVPGRHLFLPDDPHFRPSKKHLQFHRMVVARYRQ